MIKIVLIADANVLQLRMESVFKHYGLVVDEVKRVDSLHNYYKKTDTSVYVVDLDSHINGVEVVKELRSFDNKPIIAMSKKANVHLLKQVVVAGCNDFILMPFADQTLLFKVQKLIGVEQNEKHSPNKFVPMDLESLDVSDLLLTWDNKISIDVKEIDEEHRSIIKHYEKLYQLMCEGKGHDYYKELLELLDNYVDSHFEHEEKLHDEKEYPLKEEHKKHHEEFKLTVKGIVDDGKGKKPTNQDLLNIGLFVKNWLIHHILVEDMKFASFLEESK